MILFQQIWHKKPRKIDWFSLKYHYIVVIWNGCEYGIDSLRWTIALSYFDFGYLAPRDWSVWYIAKVIYLTHLMINLFTHISDTEPQELIAGLYNFVFRISIAPHMKEWVVVFWVKIAVLILYSKQVAKKRKFSAHAYLSYMGYTDIIKFRYHTGGLFGGLQSRLGVVLLILNLVSNHAVQGFANDCELRYT